MGRTAPPDLTGQVVVVTGANAGIGLETSVALASMGGDTGALGWFIKVLGPVVLRSPKAGSRTSVKLASSRDRRIVGATGTYWSRGRRWPASRRARSAEEARWLWGESERLVAATSNLTVGSES